MRAARTSWLRGAVAGFLVLVIGFVAGRASVDPVVAPDGVHRRLAISRTQESKGPRQADVGSARRTRAAAVSAATAYVLALDGPALLDPTRRQKLIERIGAEEARRDLEDSLGRVASLLSDRLGLTPGVLDDDSFVWRVVPAGWQIVSYDGKRAEVAIWATGVAMVHGRLLAPQAWRTTFVDVLWERGDWRLVGFRSEAGPEPPALGDQASGRAIAQKIHRFEVFALHPRREDSP